MFSALVSCFPDLANLFCSLPWIPVAGESRLLRANWQQKRLFQLALGNLNNFVLIFIENVIKLRSFKTLKSVVFFFFFLITTKQNLRMVDEASLAMTTLASNLTKQKSSSRLKGRGLRCFF